MISSRKAFAWILAAFAVGTAACADYDSATDLNPDGPPMIRQVRMRSVVTDATGNSTTSVQFVFGEHPDATEKDYPGGAPVTAATPATASLVNNKFRVIIDELLVGNSLEEIACRGPVDNDAYSAVPLGSTPEDIAKCAVPADILPASCPATSEHAVCICQIDSGCGSVAKGEPVGVLDVNQDGAADDTRLIQGAAGIRCGSIDVPIDPNASYWNPSGNQNKPAMGGFDALGPAIVLSVDMTSPDMGGHGGALPTGQTCGLSFASNVVDKTGHQICAPPDGDITQDCTPGDVSAFQFKTQAFTIRNNTFQDGATGVGRTSDITFVATAPVDKTSATTPGVGIVVTGPGNTPVTNFTLTQPMPQSIRLKWGAGALAANTTYTISITTGLHDTYGLPVQPVSFTFTTGA